MPKMHQNTFGGPDPLGKPMRSPRPFSHNGGASRPTSKKREGMGGRQRRGLLLRGEEEGKGPTFKGDGREGREERGDRKGTVSYTHLTLPTIYSV